MDLKNFVGLTYIKDVFPVKDDEIHYFYKFTISKYDTFTKILPFVFNNFISRNVHISCGCMNFFVDNYYLGDSYVSFFSHLFVSVILSKRFFRSVSIECLFSEPFDDLFPS